MSAEKTCLILTGGSGFPTRRLPVADLVIAADSGLEHAAGMTVDLVVGDMDSADPSLVEAAVAGGAAAERHPADKDATDLDLALAAAARMGATRAIVAGGGGSERIDHVLGNAGVIASNRHAGVRPEWWVGRSVAVPVRGRHEVAGDPGDLVSILAAGGPATVTATGTRWPLDRDTIEPGSSRGLSNRLISAEATVEVHSGVVLVIHTKEDP